MKREPLVSAIIPAHNGSRFIGQAISSVLQQDYRAVELIVVDDGSTDDTADLVRAHPGAKLIRQENAGVASARNVGVKASNGEFLAFLDQDDIWTPYKLTLQMQALGANESIGYALGYQKIFLENGTPIPDWLQRSGLDSEHVGYFPGTLVVRRQSFERIGGFSASAVPAEGADWFLRASEHGERKTIVKEVVLLKRIHDQNQSGNMTAARRHVLNAIRQSIQRRRRVTST